ncbi:hypothetical protein FHS14_006392 [Paenibacillus baekrokdamisoli]|nr:hypothetical protein [Paenibacillus baekrokdamisoli]
MERKVRTKWIDVTGYTEFIEYGMRWEPSLLEVLFLLMVCKDVLNRRRLV